MSTEWGVTNQNMEIISQAYKQIGDIYESIAHLSLDEIRRIHPIYWKQYKDCELEIDNNCKDLSTEGFQVLADKMVDVWSKIADKANGELEELKQLGIPPPPKKHTEYTISFTKDEKTEVVLAGYLTIEEIREYFDDKVTVRNLQQRNIDEYSTSLKRRDSKQTLIGPCGLSNDGTGSKTFSIVQQSIPTLDLLSSSNEQIQSNNDMPIPFLDIAPEQGNLTASIPMLDDLLEEEPTTNSTVPMLDL